MSTEGHRTRASANASGDYDHPMGPFRKRRGGSLVESTDGFVIRVTVDDFPGMQLRYMEGSRTMDVFAEAMVDGRLILDRSSMAYWNPPHTREGMDDATRQKVLDRIVAGLSFSGYVIEPAGEFPKPGDQLRRRVSIERAVAEARRSVHRQPSRHHLL